MHNRFSTVILAAALAAVVQASDFSPKTTKVALVPVLNSSGESWAEAKSAQAKRGDEELRALFEERDFQLVPDAEVASAISTLKIDLSDEEQQKRDTLYRLGDRVGADIVVFVVITAVDQRKVAKFLVTSTEGKAKMKGWVVDAKKKAAILSAKVFEGDSKSGGLLEIGEKGSSRKQLAVANGLRKGLDEFLKSYPVTHKISRSKVG